MKQQKTNGIWLLVSIIALGCDPKEPNEHQLKGDIAWERSYGGSAPNSLATFILTRDGGYLLGGNSSSPKSGDKSEPNFGADDYWVVKTDNQGKKLWDRTLGGFRLEVLTSLVETRDGGYLIGGFSQSGPSGNKTTGENRWLDFDFWVIKVNASGEIQWQKTFGKRGDDRLKAILPVKDGGYMLIGETGSPETGVSKGGSDFWVVKIDEQGQKIWDKCYGGTGWELVHSAVVTSDHCFLLGGNSNSDISGDKSAASRGGSDFWIVKITADGVVLWDQTYGGTKSESVTGITTAPNGGYLLTGVTDADAANGEVTRPSTGLYDYWITRIEGTGKLVWNKTLGDTDNNYADSQPTAHNNGFLVGGYTWSPSGSNRHYYSLTNIDDSGNVVWEKFLHLNTVKKIIVSNEKDGYLIGGSGELLNGGNGKPGFWIALVR